MQLSRSIPLLTRDGGSSSPKGIESVDHTGLWTLASCFFEASLTSLPSLVVSVCGRRTENLPVGDVAALASGGRWLLVGCRWPRCHRKSGAVPNPEGGPNADSTLAVPTVAALRAGSHQPSHSATATTTATTMNPVHWQISSPAVRRACGCDRSCRAICRKDMRAVESVVTAAFWSSGWTPPADVFDRIHPIPLYTNTSRRGHLTGAVIRERISAGPSRAGIVGRLKNFYRNLVAAISPAGPSGTLTARCQTPSSTEWIVHALHTWD